MVPEAIIFGVFMPTTFCIHAQTGAGAPQFLETSCAGSGLANILIVRNIPKAMHSRFVGAPRHTQIGISSLISN
ncbi:hypothetical protein N9M31_02740 [Alphaproteobacteria bacterium]|nr:hypothetical protein [Alphaproteobacteria bacterium]